MSLLKQTVAPKSRTNYLETDIQGGLLAVTIGDVRTALCAGFSSIEVEYMLDLPEGRVAGMSGGKIYT